MKQLAKVRLWVTQLPLQLQRKSPTNARHAVVGQRKLWFIPFPPLPHPQKRNFQCPPKPPLLTPKEKSPFSEFQQPEVCLEKPTRLQMSAALHENQTTLESRKPSLTLNTTSCELWRNNFRNVNEDTCSTDWTRLHHRAPSAPWHVPAC